MGPAGDKQDGIDFEETFTGGPRLGPGQKLNCGVWMHQSRTAAPRTMIGPLSHLKRTSLLSTAGDDAHSRSAAYSEEG